MTRRLGRYHLVEPIGGGPTGEVHRARVYGVAGFERQFAVKRFHAEVVADANIAARLSLAARAYGGLEHPRIARLFEYGVAGGETFTACELVPGLDLAQLLGASQQGLPPGAAFSLIASAARAVGYAHGRGILHLGLAPTNLIATPDGDVKVTDVGILSPRLPQRPSDDPALMWRLAYLAPEQLIGESTSAATDVFAFGVIAFELITGQRAFVGATALDVEQAILSAQPRELPLPKPLLRVLQRCWARSPFERFPDARALADAVDAALRLAPVPGGKREVAALVRDALTRIEHVRDQQLSGALNLPMPSVVRRPPSSPPERVVVPQPSSPPIASRQSQPIPRPASQTGSPPAGRIVVPPVTAVPIPPRALPRGSKPSRPPQDDTTGEVTIARSPLDQALSALHQDGEGVTPPPVALSAVVSRAPGDRGPVPAGNRLVTDHGDSGPTAVRDTPDLLAQSARPDLGEDDKATSKMPPVELSRALTFSEALEPEIIVERPLSESDLSERGLRLESSGEMELDSGDMAAVATGSPPPVIPSMPRAPSVATPPPMPVPLPLPRKTPSALGQIEPDPDGAEPFASPPRKSRRLLWAVLGIVMAGGAAVAGVMAWQQWGDTHPKSSKAVQPPPAAKSPDAGARKETIASVMSDAAPAPVPAAATDAATATATATATDAATATATGSGSASGSADKAIADAMSITSTPPGAVVFLDGAEQGPTPITVPTARDKHTVAVFKPGFDLFLKDVDGPAPIAAQLAEVTPSGGEAGIKVKCVHKDRYYVYVDGHATGQLCPTERIHVSLGPHTVEVYDLVTESRTQYPVVLKDTEHSLRVKLD